MTKRKRNMVLEILVCAALFALVFLAYMGLAKNNSGLEIVDISGDRAHLAAFSFDGIAGDASGWQHFTWDEGELETEYYPVNGWGMDTILTAEEEGKTGFRKFFGQYDYGWNMADAQIVPVAADGAVRKNITELSELTEENQKILREKMDAWYGELPYGSTMAGYTADEIMLYAEVSDWPQSRYARFFTGLTLQSEEFYFTEWKYSDGSRMFYIASELELGLAAVETEDAFYTILKTGADCVGEVFLQKVPKEEMSHGWGSELLWKKAIRGETEVLRTFPVDGENRIIGMTLAAEDRLLLARSEGDTLLLEQYDLNGNCIASLKTDVEQVSQYELYDVSLHRRGEQTVLWLELARRVNDTENPEDFHYEVDRTVYYLCDGESIRELPVEGYAEYVDYADGKVLLMEYKTNSDDKDLYNLVSFYITGYEFRVVDGETGELLYEGELTSDFTQDYYRKLTVLNIGRRAGYLLEEPSRWDRWSWEEQQKTEIRNFDRLLPLYGELNSDDWRAVRQSGYTNFHHYYG